MHGERDEIKLKDVGHLGLYGLRALNDGRQSFGLPERADGGEVSREAMVLEGAVDVGFWPEVRGHHLLQPNLVFFSAHSDVLLHREMVLAFGVDYGRLTLTRGVHKCASAPQKGLV